MIFSVVTLKFVYYYELPYSCNNSLIGGSFHCYQNALMNHICSQPDLLFPRISLSMVMSYFDTEDVKIWHQNQGELRAKCKLKAFKLKKQNKTQNGAWGIMPKLGGRRGLFRARGMRRSEIREARSEQGPRHSVGQHCQPGGLCEYADGLCALVYRHRSRMIRL